jgi:hypothetical protein
MLDDVAQLSQVYVAPTGSKVPNNAPNSADTPLLSFDVVITGERGDEVRGSYALRFDACDLTTCERAPAVFNGSVEQSFDNAALWTPIPPPAGSTQEDFITVQTFTISLRGFERTLRGHIFQYTASLIAADGDLVSFVQSAPFILV